MNSFQKPFPSWVLLSFRTTHFTCSLLKKVEPDVPAFCEMNLENRSITIYCYALLQLQQFSIEIILHRGTFEWRLLKMHPLSAGEEEIGNRKHKKSYVAEKKKYWVVLLQEGEEVTKSLCWWVKARYLGWLHLLSALPTVHAALYCLPVLVMVGGVIYSEWWILPFFPFPLLPASLSFPPFLRLFCCDFVFVITFSATALTFRDHTTNVN